MSFNIQSSIAIKLITAELFLEGSELVDDLSPSLSLSLPLFNCLPLSLSVSFFFSLSLYLSLSRARARPYHGVSKASRGRHGAEGVRVNFDKINSSS